uniref:Uncharacterized protein n=1 Tax=Cannabis sativa TaxID=3483 RepID=A0A803R1M5_CANSA
MRSLYEQDLDLDYEPEPRYEPQFWTRKWIGTGHRPVPVPGSKPKLGAQTQPKPQTYTRTYRPVPAPRLQPQSQISKPVLNLAVTLNPKLRLIPT